MICVLALNEVTLLGRVGGEPQKRGTEEHPVVIFSLATHTNYKYDTGEFVQRTDWHRVCVFKPSLRDTVYNYMKKGQRVYVSGRLTYGEVKDDEGNARSTTAIVADDVIFFQSTLS
ncbi:Single-stranded DNA-binding protein [Blattella germanica]|nr:Single-stranded DNA-binding protein [Blattella germanica]